MIKTNPIVLMPFLFFLAGAANLSDPTRPPSIAEDVQTPQAQSLELTAIFHHPTYNLAIISGQALKIGDHIGEYTVTTINTNTVELVGPQNANETLQLSQTVKQEK